MLETLFDVSGLDREDLEEQFEDYFESHQADWIPAVFFR